MGIINQIIFFLFFFVLFSGGFFVYKKGAEIGKKTLLEYMLLFGALFFIFLSVFEFSFFSTNKKNVQSSNIVFLLDVGKSMLVQDYGEYSRLQVAKGFIKSYVQNFPNNRYSLVLFSGDALSVLPFTSEKELFFQFLDTADEKSLLKSGSQFLEGLSEAYTRFGQEEQGGGIILLSDFETNLESSIYDRLIQSLGLLKKKFQEANIVLINIGFGDEKGGKIPETLDFWGNMIYKKDVFGNTIISSFSKDFFEKLSVIFQADSKHMSSLLDIEKKYYFDIPSETREVEISGNALYAKYFLMGAYVLFLAYLFLFYYRQKNEKSSRFME